MIASAHCTMMATEGVRKRGWTSARDLKKYPSRAIAKDTRAPLMMVPFKVASMEMAMAADTRLAPVRPSTRATASEAGRSEVATAEVGSTYCTAALTRMYNSPTVATPQM